MCYRLTRMDNPSIDKGADALLASCELWGKIAKAVTIGKGIDSHLFKVDVGGVIYLAKGLGIGQLKIIIEFSLSSHGIVRDPCANRFPGITAFS